jgi:transcriptional regulator with XRE-family HTH domain
MADYGENHQIAQGLEKHIGERIRFRRSELGLTQDKLADMAGVSFQQIQKYETGQNAMRITSLYRLARILLVDVSFFFEGFKDYSLRDASEDATLIGGRSKEMMSLMRNFQKIPNAKIKKSIATLIRSLSSEDGAAAKE